MAVIAPRAARARRTAAEIHLRGVVMGARAGAMAEPPMVAMSA
jgi:hypothetical protein